MEESKRQDQRKKLSLTDLTDMSEYLQSLAKMTQIQAKTHIEDQHILVYQKF